MFKAKARLFTWYESVSASYWFIPSLMSVGAVALSVGMLRLDSVVSHEWLRRMPWLYTGTAAGAQTLLGVIASSMVGLAGVVFSITIVALTLASGQFGARLLRNFMRDKGNQITLGTFLAAFLYCLLILRNVHGGSDDGMAVFVPQLSMLVAMLMALFGLGVLIFVIHHSAESIQAPNVIAAVTADLHAAIDDLFPEAFGANGDETTALRRDAAARAQLPDRFTDDSTGVSGGFGGYIQRIETAALMTEAESHDLIVRVEHRPGHYVQWDDVIIRAWPRSRARDTVLDSIRQTFAIGDQRSLSQDAEFAVEQLVEVASRALSPGVNDPFTAMQCVDRLGEALSRLATREFPSQYRLDEAGRLRVIAYPKTFSDFLDISLNQIRQYAANSVDVLLRMLETLERVARHVRRHDDERALREHATMIHDHALEACKADRDRRVVEIRYAAIETALQQGAG